MKQGFLKTAAIFGALSVAFGAFAAHGLKQAISDNALNIFETGVRYQFYHSIALLMVAILYKEFPGRYMKWAGILFIAGIIIFSGSLYCLAFIKGQVLPDYNWIGAVTPVGGICFIIGWLLLFAGVSVKRNV